MPSNQYGTNTGGYKVGQVQNFTPEQMQLFQSMFGQLGPDSYTSRLANGDQQLFNEIEAPALKQFNALQGNTASRFSGMGMGARNSSGFQNATSQASQDFAGQLQSQRQSMMQQAIKDLMGMSSTLLGQRPYENFLIKPDEQDSGMMGFLKGVAPLAGAGFGGYFGGMPGAQFGAQLGGSFAKGF